MAYDPVALAADNALLAFLDRPSLRVVLVGGEAAARHIVGAYKSIRSARTHLRNLGVAGGLLYLAGATAWYLINPD